MYPAPWALGLVLGRQARGHEGRIEHPGLFPSSVTSRSETVLDHFGDGLYPERNISFHRLIKS